MKKIIVAVYKKTLNSKETMVGIFLNSLEKYPEIVVFLDTAETPEKKIAKSINSLLAKEKNFAIDFFEGTKIVGLKGKAIVFIPPKPYFFFDDVIKSLEI